MNKPRVALFLFFVVVTVLFVVAKLYVAWRGRCCCCCCSCYFIGVTHGLCINLWMNYRRRGVVSYLQSSECLKSGYMANSGCCKLVQFCMADKCII